MDIYLLAEEIRKDKKPRNIKVRDIFEGLGCYRRTQNNCACVDEFLYNNKLEIDSDYYGWFDKEVTLRHKAIASTKTVSDPVRRVNVLESASKTPTYVANSDTLDKAISLMRYHHFTQLPVTNNNKRGLIGYISWETIGCAKEKGATSNLVKDYLSEDVKEISPDTPLIEAIKVVEDHDFAVVVAKDASLQGIITTADITAQFISNTEPFVILEEIELQIRNMLKKGEFLVDELKNLKTESGKDVNSIDDLTFAQYLEVIGNKANWDRLGLCVDKTVLLKHLQEVRAIRNDVMHFSPEGISTTQRQTLKLTAEFIREITK
jgi:predicted transcriptional regulator